MADRQRPILTSEDKDLAGQIGFDAEILLMIKQHNIESLRRLTVQGFDESGHPLDVPEKGFTFDVYRRRAELLIQNLRPKLAREGCLVFMAATSIDQRQATVAVIKGTDQYDILRMMRTCDVNGDKTNEAVIAKLKDWEQRYPFNIRGAGYDWIEATFRKMPTDITTFANEVVAFSPDVYGQGDWEDMEDFVKAMRRMRGFYLWWD
jgi:Domain of unknown function (DUF4253)